MISMNRRVVLYNISRILLLVGLLLFLPILVGLYYRESFYNIAAFLKSILIIALVSLPFAIKKPKNSGVYIKEGMIVVSLSWILISFFGSLPFYFSGQIPSLVDAFFETASGFTTTGSSILTDVESLSNSMLFWRSFTHFIGGMGVLVLVLAISPNTSLSDIQFMKAEVPGPQFGKMLSKLKSTAQLLYLIYIGMTIILIFALVIAGMPVFDSILHAFGTAGTGGFGIKAASIGYYNSASIEIIISIGMILFGVNFHVFYLILIGKVKDALRSEELKTYLSIIAIATLLIFINILPSQITSGSALRQSLFSVSSVMTTTGYSTADFNTWPMFSKWVLVTLMFIGGCAGSTAGGIKVSRVIIIFKTAVAEVKKIVSPNRCVVVNVDNRKVEQSVERGVSNYLLIYAIVFMAILGLISFFTPDFETAFTSVAATFNNIGPGLGVVGPTGSFAMFHPIAKIILSFAMIAGRLEIVPVLFLFNPGIWKN